MAHERKSASKPGSVQEACQPARKRRPSTAREARIQAAREALTARCACGATHTHANPVRFVFVGWTTPPTTVEARLERWAWQCAQCRQGRLF